MGFTRFTKSIIILFILVGLTAGVSWAAEDLYVTNSRPGWNHTDIYKVFLNPMNGHGELTYIGQAPIGESYAMGCTPDNQRCYLISKWTNEFGYLDLADASWHSLPTVYDPEGNMVPQIGLAAFSPDGVLYVASQVDDQVYIVDTSTGVASLVGHIEEDVNRGHIVDIYGSDMAFTADGRLYLWTNSTQTMYELTLPDTDPGIIIGTKWFDQKDTFVTGLAFRANGWGGPVGSQTSPTKTFLVMDGSFPMYLNGSPFNYGWGDMANGSMNMCTLTIGYYKNHDWNGTGVHVCGVMVDEDFGANIMWNAKSKNFSMLFAQLIAAKLNVGDAGGLAVIDDAEAWLCSQDNAFDPATHELLWDADFADHSQKADANSFEGPLDDFNNSNHCD